MPADPMPPGPRAPAGFLAAGSEMVSFTLMGLLLDYILGTMPWFTIVLTLLGFVAAFFQLLQMAKAFTKPKALPPRSPEEPVDTPREPE